MLAAQLSPCARRKSQHPAMLSVLQRVWAYICWWQSNAAVLTMTQTWLQWTKYHGWCALVHHECAMSTGAIVAQKTYSFTPHSLNRSSWWQAITCLHIICSKVKLKLVHNTQSSAESLSTVCENVCTQSRWHTMWQFLLQYSKTHCLCVPLVLWAYQVC